MDTKRAVIYNRVSTAEQIARTELNSMETHKESCIHYIKAMGWELVGIYEDPALSGGTLKRPELQRLLHDIRKRGIDYVVVHKLDRLSRSVKDFCSLMESFEKENVSFVSVSQNLDTSTPTGRLLRNILASFAEFEREMIAERTKDKMLSRAQKGLWNGGNVSYGYRSENKKLVVEPKEARIVKDLFDIYWQTRSLAKVVAYIKTMGYRTREGKPWSKSTLWNVLSNPLYAGKITFRDKIFDGIHEPLIPRDKFQALGFMEKRREHANSQLEQKRIFLLKGLLKCTDCGSTLTPHYIKKKNGLIIFYYRCTKTSLYPGRSALSLGLTLIK